MPANPQGLALYWTVHGRNLKRWHHSLQLYCCPNCGRLAQHAKGGEPSHLAQPQSQSSWPLPQPLDVSVSYSLEGRCSAQRQSSTPPSTLNPVDPRSKLAWTQGSSSLLAFFSKTANASCRHSHMEITSWYGVERPSDLALGQLVFLAGQHRQQDAGLHSKGRSSSGKPGVRRTLMAGSMMGDGEPK